ncbi:hypothetical protein QKU48_gp0640 [Fadolivirus algeromassiliense]|jgi:hypothetical protein|uniref:Uncharacterized protein n=1 Tax=Fadolivirus FV1/VV64 TaxID=3070911 RepID=A0A7D3R1Y7_9VIRU|nr:hypothetical protein QKU48_gp0640 [Fadolivirus algeromassiliense]QKF94098.1 hypothetical protein Fadolivirus_1_640 [Fadolivirus FV1/VV64]
MECPICNCKTNVICDNDCGSYFCSKGHEFYKTQDGKLVQGHNPLCGEESDIDIDDD